LNTDNERKQELIRRWNSGYKWLGTKEEDSNNKGFANDGNPYNHKLFLKGMERMEGIEIELRELGITDKDYLTENAVKTFTTPL
jgi:hypothetical protein